MQRPERGSETVRLCLKQAPCTRIGAHADPDGGCVSYWYSHALSLSGSARCPKHARIRTEFLEGISDRHRHRHTHAGFN